MAGKVFFSVTMSLDGFIAPDPSGIDGAHTEPAGTRRIPKQLIKRIN